MTTDNHIIKNFDRLATSGLRRQALLIAEAGLAAINTKAAIGKTVKFNQKSQILSVAGNNYRLGNFDRLLLVGFGKAAFDAAAELQAILGDKITDGLVIGARQKNALFASGAIFGQGSVLYKEGTHPFISEANIKASGELAALVSGLGERDLAICLTSGGGSALFELPFEKNAAEEAAIFKTLTAAGASILELNTARKHISQVKGGQLAKLMYPARVINLIFSDVPGDDTSMVASGPMVLDATTVKDAGDILKKYNVLETCGLPVCRLTETPKDKKYFQNVKNILVVSAKQALREMKVRAEDLGWEAIIYSSEFQGEARELGPKIVAENKKGQCLLGAGESTVKIIGTGLGGRNQEMALAALPLLAENQVLACVASDGADNTDAAGAIVDAAANDRAKNLGLDSKLFLQNNDSYDFFEQTGDLLKTGPTGANVSDFFVCLKN